MPALNLYQVIGDQGGITLAGTTAGTVFPASIQGTPAQARLLYDGDDATYWQIVGGGGTDQSMIAIFVTAVHDEDVNSSTLLPSNATDVTVALRARIRNANTGCAASGFNSFVEVWSESGGIGAQVANLELPAAFTWTETDIPERPDGGGPWIPDAVYTMPFFFGLRARTECFTSVTPTLMGVDWAEGNLAVTFRLPDPLATIGRADAINPRGATVYGTVNPALTYIGDGAAYTYEYGFTVGSVQNNLPPYVYYGTVSGIATDITVSHEYVGNLTPGATWYYRMAVRDPDGNVTESDTASFVTPLTDPIRGVY